MRRRFVLWRFGITIALLGVWYWLPDFLEIDSAIVVAQTLQDRKAEADRLSQRGNEYYQVSQLQEALAFWQAALKIYRKIGDRIGEGSVLGDLSIIYRNIGQYQQAIELSEQSLVIAQAINDRAGEGRVLGNLGNIYHSLGQYQQSIDFYEQSLIIAHEIDDNVLESYVLGNLGRAFNSLGRYQQAIGFYEQSLLITREISNRSGKKNALGGLASVYANLGQYQSAIDFYEQELVITYEIGDRLGEGNLIGNLATIYNRLGQYQKAVTLLEQQLIITREIGDRFGEGNALGGLGDVYRNLGQYQQSTDLYEQQLIVAREIGDRLGEGFALGGLGTIYEQQGQYQQAISLYEQVLSIAHELNSYAMKTSALGSLGDAYSNLNQYQRAVSFYEQALVIAREIGDRPREAAALGSLGNAYNNLNQHQQAINFYEQDLAIIREISDRRGEAATLSNLGSLMQEQNQLDLAIAFYKRSVNSNEQIRANIHALSIEEQEAYAKQFEATYRSLADLLLKQGRILEAQRVLELLKVEEIRDYTRNQRAVVTSDGIRYTPLEEEIIREHDSLIAFGQRINQCEQENCAELERLYAQRRDLTDEYNNYIATITADIRANRSEDDVFYDPRNLSNSAREIVQAQPGTMLIYPLVLEDKLWLLWVAPNGIANRVEVPVTQSELGNAALQFRQLLDDPSSDLATLQDTAQQLYTWLIQPLEAEIEANQIQNLVFSLDRVTRYIPMAALFDGEQYLVERFTLSTILSAELTDMSDRLSAEPQSSPILAMGVSEAKADFDPLPFVEQELDEIVRLDDADTQGVYPGSVFLNDDFNLDALDLNLPRHAILHLATHAKFEPGVPEESYLLMGNGEPLTIDKVNTLYNLASVNMVVLSACETALGGPDAEGLEIAGLGFYFLADDRASTLIASLWQVNDASTSQLMQRFYQNLASNTATAPMTKAEALRQAQLSLLQGNATTTEAGSRFLIQSINADAATTPICQSHPYYWAPFVLIGNHL